MVNFCAVFGCSNRADRDKDKSFFRFPKVITHRDPEEKLLSQRRRREWIAKLHRKDVNDEKVNSLRICSDHFVKGKPAALFDSRNIDWVPTQWMGYENSKSSYADNDKRYERLESRRKRKLDQSKIATVDALGTDEPNISLISDSVNKETDNNKECQTVVTNIALINMENELSIAKQQIVSLNNKMDYMQMKQTSFQDEDDRVCFYTGLPSFYILNLVFSMVEPYLTYTARSSLTKFQQFILFFLRIRLNLTITDIGDRFQVSPSTVSRLFHRLLDIMHKRLNFLIKWPERSELIETTPMAFRKHFKTKVAIIIDCFEIFIDRPANLLARAQTFSTYKHHNTVKYLIGISPQGSVAFISTGYGGRVSDKFITENSGILTNLLPGDIILADRGFDIGESVAVYFAEVKIPAFTQGKKQLAPIELEQTRKIGNVRIHVERVIGLVKRKFSILQGSLPLDYLSNRDTDNVCVVDKIVSVCCALTNLCDSVVPFD